MQKFMHTIDENAANSMDCFVSIKLLFDDIQHGMGILARQTYVRLFMRHQHHSYAQILIQRCA